MNTNDKHRAQLYIDLEPGDYFLLDHEMYIVIRGYNKDRVGAGLCAACLMDFSEERLQYFDFIDADRVEKWKKT